MSVSVTISGATTNNVTATSGDVIDVTVSPAGAPGAAGPQGPTGPQGPAGPAGGAYSLPAATVSTLGGVKVGTNLSVSVDGTLSASAGGSGAWGDITGKPTTFAPIAHATSHGSLGGDPVTLAVSQVTGLQAALDGKQSIGSYAPLVHTHTASAITDFSTAVAAAIPASVVVTTDSRLSDSRSPTSHAASHAAGGADAVTLTMAQVTGLQTAIDAKAATSSLATVATTGAYADLSGKPTIPGAYSLPTASDSVLGGIKIGSGLAIDAGGVVTASGGSADALLGGNYLASLHAPGSIETLPRNLVNTTVSTGANLFQIYLFTPAVTTAVTGITVCSGNAGLGITTGRLGLFTWNEATSTATCVAKCANSTTLLTATGTMYRRDFDPAGGFPTSYTLQAGTRYGFGVLFTATGQPAIAGAAGNTTLVQQSPRINGYKTSSTGTDFAASYSPVQFFLTGNAWAKFS
jgi:hypothetical protein